MNIDRRSFLSLGVGATAGTLLTPLPWKLMDDVSIWSQNWSWVPVPKDGKATYTDTVCALCPGGCGITVRKIDNRVVKIEGKKGSPSNNGGVCILGLSVPQLLYSPARIKTPLKKTGETWSKISVNQAIFEIAARLESLREKEQSHTVACISGRSDGTVARLFERFLKAYGSPNFITNPSVTDTYKLMFSLMHGKESLPVFDIENADFVVSFGAGLLEGWGSPVRSFQAHSILKDQKKKFIQIEPRLSNTSAKADKWIPIYPGTEGLLALGMANVIVTEGIYNRDFVEKSTSDFKNFVEFLKNYSPEQVSPKTGIKATAIIELAREFAKASKGLALCGRGEGATPGALQDFMAIHSLNALVGNINTKGGIYAASEADYIKWSEPVQDAIASEGFAQKRMDGAGTDGYYLAKHLLNRLPEAVNFSEDSTLNVLFIANANPYYTMPNTKLIRKTFKKIPFKVSFSSYMDETAEISDIILPNHFFLERYEDVVVPGILNPTIGLMKPIVSPLFDTAHSGDAIIAIAKTIGGSVGESFPWKDYEACLKETLNVKWNLMENEVFSTESKKVPSFETESEKFEFLNSKFDMNKPYALIEPEGKKEAYPLTLIPYDTMKISAGYTANSPFMTKTIENTVLTGNDIFVEVNPKTAKAYNLSEKKYAFLVTPKGRAKVRIHLFDGIMPGLIAMPRGMGHTAYDKYIAGKGVNINELIGQIEDPASGLDAAWGIRAQLT